jgi:hypothetical protein
VITVWLVLPRLMRAARDRAEADDAGD